MPCQLNNWQIKMDTDDWWWRMGKVVGGEAREVKVRDISAKLTERYSFTVIC